MLRFYRTLKIALRNNAVLMALDTLVRAAEYLIERGEMERAVQIIALVLRYPMPTRLKHRAEHHLLDLESELPEHVIISAKAQTDLLTLEDMVEELLTE
jgi:hypothetical protein